MIYNVNILTRQVETLTGDFISSRLYKLMVNHTAGRSIQVFQVTKILENLLEPIPVLTA